MIDNKEGNRTEKNLPSGDIHYVKTNEIKIKPEWNPPYDKKFIELYIQYIQKGVPSEIRWVDIENVIPFSKEWKPPEDLIEIIIKSIKKTKEILPLIVYKEGNKYIMSDDYPVYYAYLKFNFKQVPVKVINEFDKLIDNNNV